MRSNQPITTAISMLALISVMLLTSACGGMLKGSKAAEQSVAEFHKLYDEERIADIYAAAHAKFKAASTEEKFVQLMSAVHRKLGKVKNTTNAGMNIRTMNLTTMVVLTQKTTFQKGTGTEIFTFQMDDGKAVLVGYNVNSNELILT